MKILKDFGEANVRIVMDEDGLIIAQWKMQSGIWDTLMTAGVFGDLIKDLMKQTQDLMDEVIELRDEVADLHQRVEW